MDLYSLRGKYSCFVLRDITFGLQHCTGTKLSIPETNKSITSHWIMLKIYVNLHVKINHFTGAPSQKKIIPKNPKIPPRHSQWFWLVGFSGKFHHQTLTVWHVTGLRPKKRQGVFVASWGLTCHVGGRASSSYVVHICLGMLKNWLKKLQHTPQMRI